MIDLLGIGCGQGRRRCLLHRRRLAFYTRPSPPAQPGDAAMAADGARPDELALLWKALYALAGICGAGFLFLFAFIQRGKAALWASVNQQGRDAGDTREAAALRYATKHDLEQL